MFIQSTMNHLINLLKFWIDFVLHIDKHLVELFNQYGIRILLILFAMIFIETGLVVMPFLPWDSLIFASGALAHNPTNELSAHLIWLIVFIAAVLGDSMNYEIGKFLGPKVAQTKFGRRFIKQEYLDKAQHFFDKHGGKAIIYARFVPIVRTFAPFVAGIGKMKYLYFISFNIIGAFLRATLFIYAGYFFGGLEVVQKNFTLLILGIIFLSLIPVFREWFQAKGFHFSRKKKKSTK